MRKIVSASNTFGPPSGSSGTDILLVSAILEHGLSGAFFGTSSFLPIMQTQRPCWSTGKSLNTLETGATTSSFIPLLLKFCPSRNDDVLSRHAISSCKNPRSVGSAQSCDLPADLRRANRGNSRSGSTGRNGGATRHHDPHRSEERRVGQERRSRG